MSLFSRKKPKDLENQPMTTYSPQPTQQEAVIDGIQRATDSFGGLIYNSEPAYQPQVQQPQVAKPIQQIPQQVPMQPVQQVQQVQISQDAIVNAMEELDKRLSLIESKLFRIGL